MLLLYATESFKLETERNYMCTHNANKPIHLCHLIQFHRVSNGGKHSNNILMKLDKHEAYICIRMHHFNFIRIHEPFALLFTMRITHDNFSSIRLGKFKILLAVLTSIEWACWYPMLNMSHDCLPLKPHAMTKTP